LKNQKRLTQEWLFNPEYEVWAALPGKYNNEFSERVKKRRWHFSPYLGISEHLADIQWISDENGKPLNPGDHLIHTVCPQSACTIDTKSLLKEALAIHFIRMPAAVSPGRVFTYVNYFFERNAREIPIKTGKAVLVGDKKIVFM